jgi:hypothetical protein
MRKTIEVIHDERLLSDIAGGQAATSAGVAVGIADTTSRQQMARAAYHGYYHRFYFHEGFHRCEGRDGMVAGHPMIELNRTVQSATAY